MGKKVKKLIKATKEDQVLLNSLSGIITEEHEEGVIVQADQYVFTQLEKRFEVIRPIKQDVGETPVTIAKSEKKVEKKVVEEEVKADKAEAAAASIEEGKAEKEEATKEAKKAERKAARKAKKEAKAEEAEAEKEAPAEPALLVSLR